MLDSHLAPKRCGYRGLNSAPLALRMKILETKKVIVDNTPFLRHHYESLTMKEYFDFSVKEMAILERRFFHA